MKITRKRTLVAVIAALIIILGCASVKMGKDEPSRALVTADSVVHSVQDITPLLTEALQDIKDSNQCDNFILFVHGRGKHPGKAFRQRLLTDLESDYSARVIMFHWPSWEGALAFPEPAARAAAGDFADVLKAVESFKRDRADLVNNVKFTLLTHSMGSLVLEETIRRQPDEPLGSLFDTVVISAPASYTKDHAEWVDRLFLSDQIYILINGEDPVLGSAGVREMGRRLGKGLKSRGKPVALSNRAKYIDATHLLLLHRYYLHRNLRWSPALKRFLDQVLNGARPTLDTDDQVVKIHKQKVS